MNKKLAKLTVNKSADYYNKVAEALENAGFVLVLDVETTGERYYIVAEKESEDKEYEMVDLGNGLFEKRRKENKQ